MPNINAQVIVNSILVTKTSLCQNLDKNNYGKLRSVTEEKIVYNLVLLILHMVVYLLLIIIIDCQWFRMKSFRKRKLIFNENQLDDDVLAERHRILNEESDDSLTVNNLIKYYSKSDKLAVDHLTFGAKRGEIFGLLGFNVR